MEWCVMIKMEKNPWTVNSSKSGDQLKLIILVVIVVFQKTCVFYQCFLSPLHSYIFSGSIVQISRINSATSEANSKKCCSPFPWVTGPGFSTPVSSVTRGHFRSIQTQPLRKALIFRAPHMLAAENGLGLLLLIKDHQGGNHPRHPSRQGQQEHNQDRATTLVNHCKRWKKYGQQDSQQGHVINFSGSAWDACVYLSEAGWFF